MVGKAGSTTTKSLKFGLLVGLLARRQPMVGKAGSTRAMPDSLATFSFERNNGQQYPEIYSDHKQNAKEWKIENKITGFPVVAK